MAKRNIPSETLNCQLGTDVFPDNLCNSIPSVFPLEWILKSNDILITQHKTSNDDKSEGYTNDTISRWIGSFDGQAGKTYNLDIKVLSDGSTLSIAHPMLVIQSVDVASMYYKQLYVLLALFLTFVAIKWVRKKPKSF